jgi:hypothetical protein
VRLQHAASYRPVPVFLLIAVAGWMNQQQQFAIDYRREENRVLREQLATGAFASRQAPLGTDRRRRLLYTSLPSKSGLTEAYNA